MYYFGSRSVCVCVCASIASQFKLRCLAMLHPKGEFISLKAVMISVLKEVT